MEENPYQSPETLTHHLDREPERRTLVGPKNDDEEFEYPLVVAPIVACIVAILIACYATYITYG